MRKTVRIDDRNLERIKKNLSDELYSIVERYKGELEGIFTYLDNIDEDVDALEDNFVGDSLTVYSVIRIVTFLETFLRTNFIILIDQFDRVFDLNVEMSSEHLMQLRKETKITVGQIIADSLNFQRFESSDKEYNIYKIFSNVLGVDVFAEMIKKESNIPAINKTILGLIEERHSIVHELRYTAWEADKVYDAFASVLTFIETFNEVVKENRTNRREQKI